MNDFYVIKRELVRNALQNHRQNIELVRKAYIDYCSGKAVCPNSIFLRFPWGGKDRIIGLPAYIPEPQRAGFKWISSFPENRKKGMERASAVIILNDTETGVPLACMEGALISAYRTAAFAALAAHTLNKKDVCSLGICGTSFIAKNIVEHMMGSGFRFDTIHLYDVVEKHMNAFRTAIAEENDVKTEIHEDADSMIRESEMVVFATDAIEPHVTEAESFAHNPLVLHVSLRDLGNEVVKGAQNVSDSTEHAIREGTSLGNAYNEFGGDALEIHSLNDFFQDENGLEPATDKPIIFAPFGLGILDIMLAEHVFQQISADADICMRIKDFFD